MLKWMTGANMAGLMLTFCTTAASGEKVLPLPPRAPAALTGSQVRDAVSSLSLEAREEFLYREIARGNIPEFLRSMAPVTMTTLDRGESTDSCDSRHP